MNPDVFREYDVRGVVEKDLNEAFVTNLGRAVGTFGVRRGVSLMTVGRDCRLTSDDYHHAIIKGITQTGIDVIDIGVCATPMLYFSIRHLETDGGVMVTGSHNPPEFNGFKICIGPDTIYGNDIQALRTIIESSDYEIGTGGVSARSITADYHNYLFSSINISRKLTVAVDGGNGVGCAFAVPLFQRYGMTVLPLYCDMDGNFPNHFPDPTVEDHLTDLIALVRKENADMGIAFDGDADRIGIITNTGTVLWGDELLILFSRSILKDHPGAAIIGEVKCSQTLYDDIAAHGGRGIMWKAGHSLIKGKMKEEKALLAGEMSGHLFFADRYFGYDDAIYAAARLMEIVSSADRSVSELLADLPKTFTTPEIRIDCPDHIKFRVVDTITAYFRERYPIIDIDGVRIRFDEGWGLVRASNTQPVLVLRFEALSAAALEEYRSRVEEKMNEIIASYG